MQHRGSKLNKDAVPSASALWRGALLSGMLFSVATGTAAAQKKVVDYKRADIVLNSGGGFSWGYFYPHFIEDSVRFWYESNAGEDRGTVYLVDPVAARKTVLFDKARLAAVLSVAADTIIDPGKFGGWSLRIVDTARALESTIKGKTWKCSFETYKCVDVTPKPEDVIEKAYQDKLKSGPGWATRSKDKKWDLFLYRYNVYVRPAALADSAALVTRDSALKVLKDTGKKTAPPPAAPAKPKTDSTPLPSGSIALTTDGTFLQPYGEEPRSAKPGPIAPRGIGGPWSPDSQKVVIQRYDFRGVRVMPIYSSTGDQPEDRSYFWATPGDSVNSTADDYIVNLATMKVVRIKEDPSPSINFGSSPSWNATSDRVFLVTSTRGYKKMRLVAADVSTGDTKLITQDAFSTWVEGLPYTTVKGGAEIFVTSERDGWRHVYRFGADGVLKNQVDAGPFASHVARIDSANGRIYLSATAKEPGVPYYSHLYRVNFDGTSMVRLTTEDADHSVSFSPKGDFLVDSYSTPGQPPVTVLRSAETGKVIMEITRGDVDHLLKLGWRPPEVVKVKARDGETDLWGLLYKPSNFDSTKSYPIIDHIYPGPQVGSVGNWGFGSWGGAATQALAELGFIVLELDHQGTPGRSKAFHDFYFGRMGDNGIPDHVAAIRQLGAQHSWIDLDRVGIYGFSGGGFASTDAMFRFPNFYKVAVSGAGNHHPATYGAFWAEKYQGLYNKAAYDEAANYTHAKNLKGKLLLMHGLMDDNVHPAATLKVVDALIKANKRFDLMIFPDAGHGFPRNYETRMLWDYFVIHLMGALPPDDYVLMESLSGN